LIVVAAVSQWLSGVTVSLFVSGLTVDILSTFFIIMIQRVQLMLRIFECGVLLFDRLVYR